MNVLFLVLLGVIFLKERFSVSEIISGIVLMVGVIFITYSKGEYIVLGVIVIILHSLSHSYARFRDKSIFQKIDPFTLAHFRAVFVTVYVLIFALGTGQFEFQWSSGIYFASLPSFFSVILAHMFVYKAYKLIALSKAALISAVDPLLVTIAAFLIFRDVLSSLQLIGGGLIVLGTVGLVVFRKKPKIT